MICYLIRHAQTLWNSQNRIQGSSDIKLNEVGQKQAKLLEKYFEDRKVGVLYSSPRIRAIQTAETLVEKFGLPINIEKDLAEMNLGVWEGLTPEEINSKYNNAYELWKTAPTQVEIPNAEPHEIFRKRVREAFVKIVARHAAQDIAIVTHGGPIASLLSDWFSADYDRLIRRMVIDNASVTVVDIRPDRPVVCSVNSTIHLKDTELCRSFLIESGPCV
jgi:alpha-ribazole phosphatase